MRKRYSWKWVGAGKYERVEHEIKEPRENGFYWVKYPGSTDWTIAEWHSDGHWSCLHDSGFLKDYNFDIIHEISIEKPDY